jgi:hypothetical protein
MKHRLRPLQPSPLLHTGESGAGSERARALARVVNAGLRLDIDGRCALHGGLGLDRAIMAIDPRLVSGLE